MIITCIVADERHLLFTYPAVQHVLQQFLHLFQHQQRSVPTLMWQEDFEGVARLVARARELTQLFQVLCELRWLDLVLFSLRPL
jgi:hypothetical protein